ncbi:MAG: DUF21 domain-containing protein [Planctomycetes bacterium]|nr:DUF21 domain-containing protein [Planctomycetota bacterium]
MTTAELLMLLALPVLVIGSGFFSGSETALFSLSNHDRVQMRRAGGPVAAALMALLHETRSLLITLLLGNMTINVLFFVLSSVLLIRLGQRWPQPSAAQATVLTAASLAPLLAIILLGEVMPKLVAARLTARWARLCAVPLLLVHRLIAPVRLAASVLVVTPLARLIAPRSRPPELSAEELESLMDLSQHHGVIDADEERLLQQVLELSQIKVPDLMTPRVDMEAFDLDEGPTALLEAARTCRRQRLPVYRGSLDAIEGVVHCRQVLLHPPGSGLEMAALVRPIAFVPMQQRADQLLDELRKLRSSIAVVVDEYGGTAGLITAQDITAHMAGGLATSHTEHEPEVVPLGNNRWRAEAGLPIHDWPDWFGKGRELPDSAEHTSVSTLGGLVMASLGRVPREGDLVTAGNVRLTVASMEGRRIRWITVELAGRHAEGGDA